MVFLIIIFFVTSICTLYLVAFRSKVNIVMLRVKESGYRNIISIKDLMRIKKAFKNSVEINNYDRQVLKIYFTMFLISLILSISFVILIFTLDW
jgi:hypothetical protein